MNILIFFKLIFESLLNLFIVNVFIQKLEDYVYLIIKKKKFLNRYEKKIFLNRYVKTKY